MKRIRYSSLDIFKAPDYDTPQKRKKMVEMQCRRNAASANRLDPETAIYFKGDFGKRRRKAILNCLDRAEEEFRDLGLISVAEAFTMYELMPFINYNNLDIDCDIRIGAALWILKTLESAGRMVEAYKILPDISEDLDAWYLPFDFLHPCYSEELIQSVIHVITERYPRQHRGCIMTPENAKEKEASEAYRQLLNLLPEEKVHAACEAFHAKVWELTGRYMKGQAYYDKSMERIARQIQNENSPLVSDFWSGPRGAGMDNPISDGLLPKEMYDAYEGPLPDFFNEKDRKMDLLIRGQELIDSKHRYVLNFDDLLQEDRSEIRRITGSREIAEALAGFTVDNPYEMCFSLLYLLDTNDDDPWLINSGNSLLLYALRMLPWYYEQDYDNDDVNDPAGDKKSDSAGDALPDPAADDRSDPAGDALPDPAADDRSDSAGDALPDPDGEEPRGMREEPVNDPESVIRELLSEGLRYNRNGWMDDAPVPDQYDYYHEKHGGRNLAQIIYEMCRAIVPTGKHPFESDRIRLMEEGMDETLARKLTDTAELLFFQQFQAELYKGSKDWLNYLTGDEDPETLRASWQEEEQAIPAEQNSGPEDPEQMIARLKAELDAAKKQNRSLRNTLAVTRQETKKEHIKYEHELKTLRLEHRELADLRELVFNADLSVEEKSRREKTEKEYSYPYETRKRTVIFGGHDTWLKAIRPMLPSVKFVDVSKTSFNPEIIRHADVVWIQNNCISHSQYWNIVKCCKNTGVQLRYFGFASAGKCAEQLVTEDLK